MAQKNKKEMFDSAAIQQLVKYHYLEYGEAPKSIFKFCKENNATEDQFYAHYTSFEQVVKSIWKSMMVSTLNVLRKDEMYHAFSAKEKLLAFYYTHIEVLKKNRSFILIDPPKYADILPYPSSIEYYLEEFREYSKALSIEATELGEIRKLPLINLQYHHAMVVQLFGLLQFWIADDSLSFEKTDQAIEKAVNLSFQAANGEWGDTIKSYAKDFFQKVSK